ncbi:hypothetical protein NST21_11220 [Peribacillus sp. FSL K6-1552]|uniref:hypothetical protein n=1 Tax=Peribacillus sp. FSL K6-1552 TaxID=2954514 RepID=UPI0030F95EA0
MNPVVGLDISKGESQVQAFWIRVYLIKHAHQENETISNTKKRYSLNKILEKDDVFSWSSRFEFNKSSCSLSLLHLK